MTSRFDRIEVIDRHGVTVLDMGEIEIWDGADLALLRDTLTEVIVNHGARSIGVNLAYVKYIPSGFFGMLFDWYDRGVKVRLYNPQPNVANMLWFRRFFEEGAPGEFHLQPELGPFPLEDEEEDSDSRLEFSINGD